MKKVLLLLSITLLLALSACAPARSMSSITIDDFINANGEYVFRDSRWGMTKAEVEESLGISLGEGTTLRGGEVKIELFEQEISAEIFGRKVERCSYSFQFNDDILAAISYEYFGEFEDVRQIYEDTLQMITERLGEPQEVIVPPPQVIKRTSNRWTHPHGDDEYFIDVTFTYSDEKPDNASFSVSAGLITAAQIAVRESIINP